MKTWSEHENVHVLKIRWAKTIFMSMLWSMYVYLIKYVFKKNENRWHG